MCGDAVAIYNSEDHIKTSQNTVSIVRVYEEVWKSGLMHMAAKRLDIHAKALYVPYGVMHCFKLTYCAGLNPCHKCYTDTYCLMKTSSEAFKSLP